MKTIYICHTVYHLYIALLKAYEHDGEYDIALVDTIHNADALGKRLSKTAIFNNVIVLDRKDYFGRNPNTYLAAYLNCRINKKRITEKMSFLKQYSYIYIFNDYTEIGSFLYLNGMAYHLIEDGLDVFKQYDVYQVIGRGYYIKKILYKLFKIPYSIGMTKQCLDIEVNDGNNLKTCLKHKIIVKNRKTLEEQIDNSYKKQIFFAFDVLDTDIPADDSSGKTVLILTQVLKEISVVKTDKEQYEFYANIVKGYYKDYAVYLKIHPRDSVDYSVLTSDYGITILKRDVPIEVYALHQAIKFEYVITYSSTAANMGNIGKNIVRLDESIKAPQ